MSSAGILKARKNEGNAAILRYVRRKRPTGSEEHDSLGASGAGDVLELLQLFYSFPSRNLVWKMITYSRDVPVGTLRTVRGARARGS